MKRLLLTASGLLLLGASLRASEVDYEVAAKIMAQLYEASFDHAREDFGVSDAEYISRMVEIRDQLANKEAVRSLYKDPWARDPSSGPVATIDVLALYSRGFLQYHENDKWLANARLRLVEMFSNVALLQSGVGARLRFKVVPLGVTADDEGSLLSVAEYKAAWEEPNANVNVLLGKDPDLDRLKKRWGADIVFLAVAPEDRIFAARAAQDGCGSAVRNDDSINIVATSTIDDGSFCSKIFTASHELGHLFSADHPSEPHEAEVADDEYPWRFSMMGYRDGDCKDIKPQCLRTLSYIPSVVRVFEANYRRLADINPAMRWP